MYKLQSIRGRFWSGLFLLVFSIWFGILTRPAFSDTLEAGSVNGAEELTKIRTQLEEKRESIKLLRQKEKNAYQELLDLEERLDLTRRSLRQLKLTENKMEEELRIKEESLGETNAQLMLYRDQFKSRWREIYKHRRWNPVAVIFDASSLADLTRRYHLVQMVMKRDAENLSRILNTKEISEEKEKYLKEKRTELAQLERRKTVEENSCSLQLQEKNRIIQQIRSEKDAFAQTVSQLEKNAAQLEKVVIGVQPKNPAGAEGIVERSNEMKPAASEGFFVISKGKLPWPIRGKVVSHFGEQIDPQFQTRIKNTGIEIECAAGGEVAAVAEGRVIYSSSLRGYGNLVILEHDDGYYTLYARLAEIWVSLDQEVERLQTIGTVGENGLSLQPALHFEVRAGKQPQNPLEWLRP
jgi:septal ring factor EnvC (AmiA/AmiB activator)